MKNAIVKVYESTDLTKQITTKPLEVRTNPDGTFAFDVESGKGPFVIEVVADANTEYLNELKIKDGEFVFEKAPIGMKMRSFVEKPKEGEKAQGMVNPFTEAAVTYAAKNGFSAEAMTYGKNLAKQLAGVDPFTIKPITSINDLSKPGFEESAKLMHALVGFSSQSEGCVSAIETDPIKCQLEKINSVAQDVASGSLSKLEVFVGDQWTAGQGAIKKLVDDNPDLKNHLDIIGKAVPNKPEITIPNPPAPSENAFFDLLEAKVKESDSIIKFLDDDLSGNYKYLTSMSTYAIVNQAYGFVNDCQISSASEITCDQGSNWTVVSNNKKKATRNLSGSNSGGVISGAISVEVSATVANGKNYTVATFVGNRLLDAKKESDLNLTLTYDAANPPGKGWNKNPLISIAVDSKFKAYSGSKNTEVTLKNAVLKPNADGIVDFSGDSTLLTSKGDSFKGAITSKVAVKNNAYALETFTFRSSEGKLMRSGTAYPASLAVKGNYASAEYAGKDFDQFEINGSIGLGAGATADQYELNIARNSANTLISTLRLYNLIATINATESASGKYCFPAEDGKKLCANSIQIASNHGLYKVNDFDFDNFSGQIYEGSQLIGDIKSGVIKVNGREFSLR